MEDRGGHIVPLAALRGELFQALEGVAKKVERSIRGMEAKQISQAFRAELMIVKIAGLGQAIGAKDDGVTRLKLEREFVIGDARKEAGRDAGYFEEAAFLSSNKEGAGHASAGDNHFAGGGIEDGVLNGSVTAGNTAEMEPLVEKRENTAGALAGFVDAAKSADSEGCVESGGQSFAGDVAEIEADGAVGESEIVEIIAPHFGDGLKLVGNDDVEFVEGPRGEHGALNDASFFKFLFAMFFNGEKVAQRRGGGHRSVRRG